MKLEYNHKYDSIINLEHYKSKKHPPMSLYARSAQFAPFAALTGYGEAVSETAREVENEVELDEELKAILDSKIQILSEQIKKKPEVVFTYFVSDLTKDGGAYINITGIVKKIDSFSQTIILEDKTEIRINDIIDISGDIFKICEYDS